MTTTNRRIALLTGASLAALGVSVLTATPALAAPHDTLGTGVYPGFGTADDTIVICDLDPTPTSPCFFGVIDRTGGPAIVASTAAGEIYQYVTAPDASASMANDAGSSAEVGAISVGGPAGFAHIFGPAIRQDTNGTTNDAVGTINNGGNLLIDAYATGSAAANAGVSTGILQNVNAYDSAVANLNNGAGANLNIVAIAYATSTEGAQAQATFGAPFSGNAGIAQNVNGISATANLRNAGNLGIGAQAHAYGTAAQAAAFGNEAILQNVHASGSYATAAGAPGDAVANLTNDGVINIHATATAIGTGNPYHTGGAFAVAGFVVGVDQDVLADGGNATANIANGGTLNVNAAANANGDGGALAFTLMGRGIDQAVTANPVVTGQFQESYNTAAAFGDANANLTNGGTINVGVAAHATAYFTANAFALMATGINQTANANTTTLGTGLTATQVGGDANAYLTNAADGVINVGAIAVANGGAGGGDAHANAGFFNGIRQGANADAGGAHATLLNAGAINITAAATAHAMDQAVVRPGGFSSTHVETPVASATAGFRNGILQTANANGNSEGYASVGAPGPYGTVITTYTYHGAQTASALLQNSGSINIAADAVATAAVAHANAALGTEGGAGIHQVAEATGGTAANANVTLTNSAYGTIAVGAVATAYGSVHGTANANVGRGIAQYAQANDEDGTAVASAYLTNAGVITVNASAHASAGGPGVFGNTNTGDANAGAHIGTGIDQVATASGLGTATHVQALRTGPGAYTTYDVMTGAGSANAVLSNTGSIAVIANAYATGGDADASATINRGIDQLARAAGGTSAHAHASMTNGLYGTMEVMANAVASGTSAVARASIDTGIHQEASAFATEGDRLPGADGAAYATAELSNAGAITVLANASATDARATAVIESYGIYQEAHARGSAGTASAHIGNSGSITIAANAVASAASDTAEAIARIGTTEAVGFAGIYQEATGIDHAIASLTNATYATIAINANADASGLDGASAYANIRNGIEQHANASAVGASATAALTNAGLISVGVTANAAGRAGSGTASATIHAGIAQYANAYSSAAVNLTNSGTINILANADATGDEDAQATAIIGAESHFVPRALILLGGGSAAIFQSAVSGGNVLDDASASILNTGTINVAAAANALAGNEVYALASINGGIHQQAFGGVSGTANVSFTNEGPLNMSAYATVLGGGDGTALAFVDGIQQIAGGGGGASANVYNTNVIALTANAQATVGNAAHRGSYALARAGATGVTQHVNGGTASTVTFSTGLPLGNGFSGAFTEGFPANAYASQTMDGVAFTRTSSGTTAPTGPATANLTNTGVIAVLANASAVGEPGATATAHALAVSQVVAGTSAVANVYNTGTIAATASAFASGQNAGVADAHATGIRQDAAAASSHFHNVYYGTGTLHSTTEGLPGSIVYGTTVVAHTTTRLAGTFEDTPIGAAYATVTNTGMINVVANATAFNVLGGPAVGGTTTTSANAVAGAIGIDQTARGTEAHMLVDNSGAINVSANAYASGATAANAVANALGIHQHGSAVAQVGTVTGALGYTTEVSPGGGFHNGVFYPQGHIYQTLLTTTNTVATPVGAVYETVNNSGSIDVAATARAVAGSTAAAVANATGIWQEGAGSAVFQNVYNTGTISAFASASATGTAAYATAFALGVGQTATGTTESLTMFNGNEINVGAAAVASGTYGTAYASAFGYRGLGNGGGTMTANVANYGTMNVNATAVAPDFASAQAHGIWVANAPTGPNGNALEGYITNAGSLNVVASASGGTSSSAYATGIRTNSGVNNMTITNSGAINVDAITANGGNATAYGIYVTSNGATTPAAGDHLTINNSGDIIVRVSTDGGATFQRGEAIDVSDAPNRSVINLMGNGTAAANIYGNIELRSDADTINVTDGETRFNGIINSDCMPAGGPTALTLDNEAQNSCGVGTINITSGGNFHLLNVAADGPSYVFMDTLNMGNDGTITFDLSAPVGGGNDQPIGTYPQVFVNTAHLDGTLVANIAAPANGLWDDTTYQNIIDASGTGQLATRFDTCIINGIPTGSLLIDATCIYDNAQNVDIGITRTPFNEVPGLNQNGEQVGEGLECIFDVSLTGGIANAIADLMRISDPVNYNVALNMLSGSAYANYLQSFPSLGVHHNDLLDHATNCEIPALAGSVLECRASSPIHVWGQLDAQWRKADGDIEAGTTKSTRVTGLLGIDANVGNSAIVGAAAGYVTNHTRDHQFGDHVNADGMLVGAYAVYDPGAFFVKGVTSYSWYDGDSSRHINFSGLGTGTTFVANPSGDPDVNMWTAGLHAGARFPMSGSSVVTPYLNWDYVNAKLKSFVESGDNGVGLSVESSHSRHSFLTGGVKWATQMGGVVPEVNLGYRYRFGNSRSHFRAFFNGDTDCDFEIISASQKRGTFLAGVSVGGKMGPVDLRIGYEGEFNGDITSHSGNFKFVLPLGGHAAPPPPPPVVAPPPPPPPVEVAPPPPPPAPPPPPPVERGERGQ